MADPLPGQATAPEGAGDRIQGGSDVVPLPQKLCVVDEATLRVGLDILVKIL